MPNFITPKETKTTLPLRQHAFIAATRDAIGDILHGRDSRILLVVGPCSIHNIDAAIEYAMRLQRLSTEVQDVFLVCMRTYFEKSRTALGWKGLLYDPHLDGSHNLQEGIRLSRELLVYLADLGLPAATEFLEPLSYSYLGDSISWSSIGARTCQSPVHRELASSLKMPVGIKNRCDGNIDIAIQACITAREPHHFLGIDQEGRVSQIDSTGNKMVHLVLRGSENSPNYDAASIEKARLLLVKTGLLEAIVVDCSHDNCQRKYLQQKAVFANVIEQISCGSSAIKGIMLESYLLGGSQMGSSQGHFFSKELRQSITDPCLDWETTEQLIRQGADLLRKRATLCV